MNDDKKKKDIEKSLDAFLNPQPQPEMDCTGDQCIIKTDKSLVERINKKVVTQDGRELLT